MKVIYNLFIVSAIVCFFLRSVSDTTPKNKMLAPHLLKDSVYDVFIVAGQSNTYWGLGYDSIKDKGTSGIYQLGRLGEKNLKIIEAKEPLEHFGPKPDRIGFALTFTKLYKEYIHKKNNILIIPCAMDNTSFDGDGWHRGNFLYDDAINRCNYVFKKYPKSKLIAILWHQGERDVNYKGYQKDLDTFIVHFRKDIIGANNKTLFILGGMVPYWVELKEARKKQQSIIMETALRMPAVIYVDPYLPTKIEKPNNNIDTVHYNANGQREMGKRYFEALKSITKNKK
jgi:hypothetical protein